MAGEDFADLAPDELGSFQSNELPISDTQEGQEIKSNTIATDETETKDIPAAELTPEEKMDQALQTMCPISKYKGKTLGDVLSLDPGALKWLANKFTGDEHIKEAAQMICEYAVQQTTA